MVRKKQTRKPAVKAMPGHLDTGTTPTVAQPDTADEVLIALTLQMRSLELICASLAEILQRQQQASTLTIPADALKDKAVRRTPKAEKPELPVPTASEITTEVLKKAAEHIAPAPAPAPVEPAKKVAEIKPVPVVKGVNDLRLALQACIAKHGGAVAKERLQPYGKMSDVPDAEIVATIDRLAA